MSKKIALDLKKNQKLESISHKKSRSENNLNKALYQILFNAVNDAIVLIDIHTGSFVEVNDKFCEMTGFSRAEAKGMPITALFDGEFPFTSDRAQEYIQKALTEGPQLFEWLALDRHGRRHWVELNLTAAPIGRKRYLIAAIRDIQARKEAEQKAHQSEATIMVLLNALQETALLLDPKGVIVAANEMAAKRLNRTIHELIGLNIYDLLPPEVAQYRKAMGDEVVMTGTVRRFSDYRDGIYFYSTMYPIFDHAGRVSQVGVYGMDVTEEKKTQAELEKVKARLECLLDHSPAALYSRLYTDGCELIYFSKNIFNLTGFSREEILADPFFYAQHIHPEDRHLFAETHRAGVMTEHQSREYRFLHRDGTYRWLHDEFNLVQDKQGGPLEYVGSLIDVTAAREAQEKLALSERRYRAIVECQTDLIDRFLPDGTLIYVNNADCRLFGPNSRGIDRPILSAFPDHRGSRIGAGAAKVLDPGTPGSGE